MPTIDIPGLQEASTPEKRIAALEDAYFALQRTLEFILNNLDSKNIKSLDASKIKNLQAETIITNTILTETLYAERGNIAELTVDQLVTADKLAKYEALDTTDINYIKIDDQYIYFITAAYAGGTEQMTDRNGNPLYWDSADKKYSTTTNTGYPITIYTYTEQEKLTISFVNVSGTYVPKIQLGYGNGTGDEEKAFIWKDTEGFRIDYTRDDGTAISVNLGEGAGRLRNIYTSTSDPTSSDGNDGDVWLKYTV